MRGSWLDFEFDSNDLLYVRIDKKKKILVTTFLQALGVKREEIIPLFYRYDKVVCKKGEFYQSIDDSILGMRIESGMIDDTQQEQFVGKRFNQEIIKKLKKLELTKIILNKISF